MNAPASTVIPASVSPVMAQYFDAKARQPDALVFFRMGDFYELFFEDAQKAAAALGITLTARGQHGGEPIPMAGVPAHAMEAYLAKLIRAGFKVAVCEQMEDPAEAKKRGSKSVVRRDVVRVVTPGTITEDRLLDPGRANLLLAIQRVRTSEGRVAYGLAALDISTGAFTLGETDEAGLGPEIARLEPSEIVAPQALFDDAGAARLIADTRI